MCVEGGLGVRRPSSERVSPSHGTVRGGGKVPAEIPGAPQEILRTKASPGAYAPPPQVRQVKPGPNFLSSSSPGHPEEPAVTGGRGGGAASGERRSEQSGRWSGETANSLN